MSYLTLNFLCIIGIVIGIFDDNRYRSDPKLTVLQSVDVLGLGSGPDVDKKTRFAPFMFYFYLSFTFLLMDIKFHLDIACHGL